MTVCRGTGVDRFDKVVAKVSSSRAGNDSIGENCGGVECLVESSRGRESLFGIDSGLVRGREFSRRGVAFPERGFGGGGGAGFVRRRIPSSPVTASRARPASSGSNSLEDRGVSDAIGGNGSKIDWRDIDAVSALELVSLAPMPFGVLMCVADLLDDGPRSPVRSNRVNESTSMAVLGTWPVFEPAD